MELAPRLDVWCQQHVGSSENVYERGTIERLESHKAAAGSRLVSVKLKGGRQLDLKEELVLPANAEVQDGKADMTELRNLNDSQLLAALGGEQGGHPSEGAAPLALFSLLAYQAAKAAASEAGAPAAADDAWMASGGLDAGSMLFALVSSLKLPDDEARRLGMLLQRAHAVAAVSAAPPPAAPFGDTGGFATGAPGDDEWVDVDSMQM